MLTPVILDMLRAHAPFPTFVVDFRDPVYLIRFVYSHVMSNEPDTHSFRVW